MSEFRAPVSCAASESTAFCTSLAPITLALYQLPIQTQDAPQDRREEECEYDTRNRSSARSSLFDVPCSTFAPEKAQSKGKTMGSRYTRDGTSSRPRWPLRRHQESLASLRRTARRNMAVPIRVGKNTCQMHMETGSTVPALLSICAAPPGPAVRLHVPGVHSRRLLPWRPQ